MQEFVQKVLSLSGTNVISVGQAGFIVKSSSGQLLGIDLYLSDCVERIEGNKGFKRMLPHILKPDELFFDVVICTHPHGDHFDVDAIPDMIREETHLLCSVECESLIHELHIDSYNQKITYVKPGDEIECGDFKICFVDCDHGISAPDAVGVVVYVDGKIIYEAGDTCFRPDFVDEIPRPLDVLIAPINGRYGNMDALDVIELSKIIKPLITIPCHYGMFASHGGNIKEFYDKACEDRIPFLIMRQGENYKL